MKWTDLISYTRLGQEQSPLNKDEHRTAFKRDYDRLIFSSPFRRLQNKTQVFPLPGSVFVHNRLTHSLEVSSVGMSLGMDVGRMLAQTTPTSEHPAPDDLGMAVSAACLAHDLGNPPFGHSGEKAIQGFFTEGKGRHLQDHLSPEFWSDLCHFEGNANAFRLLTHRFNGRRTGGFSLTYTTLAAIVKYPFSSTLAGKKGKFGFFFTEQETFKTIADTLGMIPIEEGNQGIKYARHPLVYLVEAADDICYEVMDIEDAHKLGILSHTETMDILLDFFGHAQSKNILEKIETQGITDLNEQIVYLRACVIGILEQQCAQAFIDHMDEIMNGTFTRSLIDSIDPTIAAAYKRCAKLSVKKIYKSHPVLDVELSGYQIMSTLLDVLTTAAIRPDDYYSSQLIRRFSPQYEIDSPSLQTRIMAVLDYISGMTDIYALDIYQKIQGTSLPIV